MGEDGWVTVVVADDEPDMRALVRAVLGMRDEFTIIGEAEDGEDAWEQWRAKRPDVLVLDQRMPRGTGLEIAARVRQEDRDQPIILFTAYLNGEALAMAGDHDVRCIDKRDVSDLPDAILKLAR
jgi:DNA-binding NarL/FixJ family response regulator